MRKGSFHWRSLSEFLEDRRILLYFPHGGGSLESLQPPNSLESLEVDFSENTLVSPVSRNRRERISGSKICKWRGLPTILGVNFGREFWGARLKPWRTIGDAPEQFKSRYV